MDDIGSFVYFIILAIIFIVNAVFSAKKKKLKREQEQQRREEPREERPQQQPKQEKSFEEILDDVFGDRQSKTTEPSRESREYERPRSESRPPTQKYERSKSENRPVTQQYDRDRTSTKKQETLKTAEKAAKNKYQKYMEAHPDLVKRTKKRQFDTTEDHLEVIDIEGDRHVAHEAFKFNIRDAIIYQAILEPKFDDV